MLKTRLWRHETLTKVILFSTFIYDFLTFGNLSQCLKVKNGDFKHFTCISTSQNKGVACAAPSQTSWTNKKIFGGVLAMGSKFELILSKI